MFAFKLKKKVYQKHILCTIYSIFQRTYKLMAQNTVFEILRISFYNLYNFRLQLK